MILFICRFKASIEPPLIAVAVWRHINEYCLKMKNTKCIFNVTFLHFPALLPYHLCMTRR